MTQMGDLVRPGALEQRPFGAATAERLNGMLLAEPDFCVAAALSLFRC